MSPSGYSPLAPYDYVLNYSLNLNKYPSLSRYSVLDQIDSQQLGKYNVKYLLLIKKNTKSHDNPIGFKKIFEHNNTIILENENFKPRLETLNNSKAEIIKYSPNQIIINFETSSDTQLILRDSYYPGWIAKINNKQVPIQKYENVFRLIDLPKGEGTIEFIYSPNSFKIGKYITFGTLLLWPILIFLL
jgi:uncharacterized membrane protein YfhO